LPSTFGILSYLSTTLGTGSPSGGTRLAFAPNSNAATLADLTYSFVTVRILSCPRSGRINRSHQRSSSSSRMSRFGKELHHLQSMRQFNFNLVTPCTYVLPAAFCVYLVTAICSKPTLVQSRNCLAGRG
jgi:hypothetical protein